jgi:hypothetical protein
MSKDVCSVQNLSFFSTKLTFTAWVWWEKKDNNYYFFILSRVLNVFDYLDLMEMSWLFFSIMSKKFEYARALCDEKNYNLVRVILLRYSIKIQVVHQSINAYINMVYACIYAWILLIFYMYIRHKNECKILIYDL